MKIAVDGFGGDNAPVEVLKGCAQAAELNDVDILLTGDKARLEKAAQENGVSLKRIEIVHAPQVIEIEDNPMRMRKDKKDCSMARAFELLASGEADAFVSAGSTAAIVVGASSFLRRIKGVKRAGLATIIPGDDGCFMLMDAGANIDCRPEMLTQFGIMGSVYMEKVMNVNSPRVAVANIGAEECKGDKLRTETYKMLETAPVNFVGNIEARDIPLSGADVVVADGFTGNIILKLIEGMGKVISNSLKRIFYKNALSMVAAGLVKGSIKELKAKMDYTEYGGAPLMGISKPVIKAHGSSNAKAFANAIKQAKFFAGSGAIADIECRMAEFSVKKEDGQADV